jgi:uncharacterized protein
MKNESDLTLDHQHPPSLGQEDYYHWLLLGLDSEDPKAALEYFEKAHSFKSNDPFLRESIARAKRSIKDPRKFPYKAEKSTYDPALSGTIGAESLRPSSAKKDALPTGIPQRQLIALLGVYFVAITTAEALTVMLDTIIFGLVIYGAMLVALIMYSAVFAGYREQRIFLTLAFAPLIRIISLSIPMQEVPMMYRYMLVGIPIFIAAIFVGRSGHFKFDEIGLNLRNLPVQLLIAPLGIVLGYIEYLILQPKPLVNDFNLNSILLPAVILLLFTGLLEELVFRGFMQKAFISELGIWGGLFFVASVFAVLHFGYLSVLDVIFVFCVAVIFGIIALSSKSLVGVTIAHGLTNLTLFLVFPFLLGKPL